MPQILSYDQSADSGEGQKKEKSEKSKFFVKSVYSWFKVQDNFTKTYVVAFLLIAVATPYIVNQYLNSSQNAQRSTASETISFVNPKNGDVVEAGSSVLIIAESVPADKAGKVEFYVDSDLKCTINEAPYVCEWKVPQSNASHKISVKQIDSSGVTEENTITVTSK